MSRFELPNYASMSREDLIERLLQLELDNGMRFETHPHYGLTHGEQALLGFIAARPDTTSKEMAYAFLYGMDDDPPEPKILDVYVCKLRKKLRPLGIKIGTVWGRGWFMEPEDRQKVQAMRLNPPEALGEAA